jgi:hypothetical protein
MTPVKVSAVSPMEITTSVRVNPGIPFLKDAWALRRTILITTTHKPRTVDRSITDAIWTSKPQC